MAATALERLREMRQDEAATGDGRGSGWPPLEDVYEAAGPVKAAGDAAPVEWNHPAADVLDILARAGVPLLHTALANALMGRGYSKAEARMAISDCQGRGWIEHDLVSGYILSGAEEEAK